MTLDESHLNCQIPCLQLVAEGPAPVPHQSPVRRLKLAIRRRLSPARERTFKNTTNNVLNRLCALAGRGTKPAAVPAAGGARIDAGDWVRVRPRSEIEATLNHWRQLKGCAFMPEQAPYCGTVQQVHKRMERFVDERDLRVKKSPGIILLAGVQCQGTADFGRCDRSCFYFWREEWLEKIDSPTVQA